MNTARLPAPATAASPWPERLERWHLPPPRLLRLYLLIWAPVVLVHMVAVETDGQLTQSFNLLSGVKSVLRNLGPQFCLLLLLWPLTGWMERRRIGALPQIAIHLLMALSFAVVCYASLWLLLVLQFGFATAEKARGNWFIWMIQWGAMMYAVAVGGFMAWRAVERARREAAAAEEARSLLARSELAALRNKLNPHFLFNTLHSMLALVRKDAQRAETALFTFSEMLRYLLDTERSGDDQVQLRDELTFTEQYLELEALRLGHRLQVQWQVDEEALSHSLPALSLQPLVENSIKHAFNPRSEPGVLRVQIELLPQRLRITVADDGPGATLPPGAAFPPGTGLGLPTVARRLALRWGPAATFAVRTAPGAGFEVKMELPR